MESVEQKIKNVENSTVNQVTGDQIVNIGITAADAIAISKEVVRIEMGIYTAKANEIAEQRLNEISNKLIEQISSSNCPQNLQKFEDPAIQFALKETYKSYIESGDEDF